jgi:hypothetical protein
MSARNFSDILAISDEYTRADQGISMDAVRAEATVYRQQMERMAWTLRWPIVLFDASAQWDYCLLAARHEYERNPTPLPDEPDALNVALARMATPQFQAIIQSRQPLYLSGNLQPSTHNATHVAEMLGDVGRGAMQAALYFALVQAWTAFEALAGDLWVQVLNAHPLRLANLGGDSDRIQKLVGQSGSVPPEPEIDEPSETETGGDGADESPPPRDRKKMLYIADLIALTKGTFDIKGKMGDVLRRRQKFTTLDGIRQAYSEAFVKANRARTTAIDAALSNKKLDALCAVRNLIVHKAGVADEDYIEDQKHAPSAPKLKLRETLTLDGTKTRDLIDPVIMCAVQLISAVDKWLVHMGAKNVRQPGPGS